MFHYCHVQSRVRVSHWVFMVVLGLLFPSVGLGAGAVSSANVLTDVPSGERPDVLFSGCFPETEELAETEDPRERIENRNVSVGGQVDKATRLRFASFSLDELDRGAADQLDEKPSMDCWFRLDGVWRQESSIVHDTSVDAGVWDSDSPELKTLAHGNYTTPGFLIIDASATPATELVVREVITSDRVERLISTDGVPMSAVFKRGGERKRYQSVATERVELTVEVTRTGWLLLQYKGQEYLRPKPGVSQAQVENQLSSEDPFILDRKLDNLRASRAGYDVVTQDAFFFLNNDKSEIFARAGPQDYFIDEKKTVPIGYTLVADSRQGTVYRKSLIASETQYQKTISSGFGFKVSGSNLDKKAPIKASVGVKSSKSNTVGMRNGSQETQALGYSRHKKYALVVDHPYVRLSDRFLDAVENARRYGEYEKLVQKFGTHYPYAVTYGGAAKMTHTFSQQEYANNYNNKSDFSAQAGVQIFGFGGSANVSKGTEISGSTSGTVGSEGTTFVAVGGNGSWNELGYSAGDVHYPILLDLRPIYELLNPMNFSEEPQIYTEVREQLQRTVVSYLRAHEKTLSSRPMTPNINERWRIHFQKIICGHYGSDVGEGQGLELLGSLSMRHYQPNGKSQVKYSFRKSYNAGKTRFLKCPKGRWNFAANASNSVIVSGTRAQLAQHSFTMTGDLWDMDTPPFDPHDHLRGTSPPIRIPLAGSKTGESYASGFALKGGHHNVHYGLYLNFQRLE